MRIHIVRLLKYLTVAALFLTLGHVTVKLMCSHFSQVELMTVGLCVLVSVCHE